MKRVGVGRLKAEVVAGATRFTDLTYSAPAKLFALQAAGTERTGATGFVLGGYGGGLLGGDRVDLKLQVGPGATLVGSTQGTTKVYKAKKDLLPTVQSLQAVLGPGSLLVLGPDPVQPFASARYTQHQRFELADDASVVVVDGVTCGRAAQGERWQFSSFSSTNEYCSGRAGPQALKGAQSEQEVTGGDEEPTRPFLTDRLVLDLSDRGDTNWSMDLGGSKRDAFASVVAIGPRAAAVGAELRRVAAAVAARGGARVRQAAGAGHTAAADEDGDSSSSSVLPVLGGSVCMGVSQGIPGGRPDATMARIVAEMPEDVTRLVARCLEPLAQVFGHEALPYNGRVHASSLASSVPVLTQEVAGEVPQRLAKARQALQLQGRMEQRQAERAAAPPRPASAPPSARSPLEAPQLWSLLQLADPTLPINGFAHSGGLEAAMHTPVFQDRRSGSSGFRRKIVPEAVIGEYFGSAASANARLYAPFTAAAHRHVAKAMGTSLHEPSDSSSLGALDRFAEDWSALNERMAALLAPVAPAHRASAVQGAALLQALHTWLLAASPREGPRRPLALLDAARGAPCATGVHFACAMGLAGALLRLPEDAALDALGYVSLRGLVAAAIRLSLLGPQRAVGFQAAAAEDWARAFSAAGREVEIADAANNAPLLEAVQGLHDLLEARLFQS